MNFVSYDLLLDRPFTPMTYSAFVRTYTHKWVEVWEHGLPRSNANEGIRKNLCEWRPYTVVSGWLLFTICSSSLPTLLVPLCFASDRIRQRVCGFWLSGKSLGGSVWEVEGTKFRRLAPFPATIINFFFYNHEFE